MTPALQILLLNGTAAEPPTGGAATPVTVDSAISVDDTTVTVDTTEI